MSWTKLTVSCPTEALDEVAAVLSMVCNSLQIEDYSDLEQSLRPELSEVIDEELRARDRTRGAVIVYLPPGKDPREDVSFVRERLAAADLLDACAISLDGVDEEDWASAWKRYYHPMRVGQHLVVAPPWEPPAPAPGDIVLTMDPGMAFGTGSHETTRLCLTLLERVLPEKLAANPALRLLDVGCGSGILSIAAAKLGVPVCFAYDIDEVAVRIARKNVAANGCAGAVTVGRSDLLASVDRSAPYDIVTANLVSDLLLRLSQDLPPLLRAGSLVLASGIIAPRLPEVREALSSAGLCVLAEESENDWFALAAEKE